VVRIDATSGASSEPRDNYRVATSGRQERPAWIVRSIQNPDSTWKVETFDNRPRVFEGVDHGHGLAHSSGGGTDINLVGDQNRATNRGWLIGDQRWRRGETALEKAPGTRVILDYHYSD
jgi:hypothetical protein